MMNENILPMLSRLNWNVLKLICWLQLRVIYHGYWSVYNYSGKPFWTEVFEPQLLNVTSGTMINIMWVSSIC